MTVNLDAIAQAKDTPAHPEATELQIKQEPLSRPVSSGCLSGSWVLGGFQYPKQVCFKLITSLKEW
jgi:hypothetical protein